MENAIIKLNKHWLGEKYPDIINRDIILNLLDKIKLKEVQVLTGVRRAGKSSILKLIINNLLKFENPKSIFFINFDDPYFIKINQNPENIFSLIETAEKITGIKIKYLFLDEIQQVYKWETFVKSAYDNELFTKIFITGSNSNLLSGEYAYLLSGRYINDKIYPFSLAEVFKYKGFSDNLTLLNNKSAVLKFIDEAMQYGLFPQVFKTPGKYKRDILVSYYDTILIKDCLQSKKIRDIKLLKYLAYYLISNTSTIYSYRSLAKAVGSNENTIREYLEILKNSFIIDEINNFSYSLKSGARPKNKNYCIDNGLIDAVSFKFSENKGKLLENLVFNEYRKAGYSEIYFYNQDKECDFILKKENKLMAVQVAYEINEQNKAREINALLEVKKKFNINNLKIITYNTDDYIDNIIIEPVWKTFSTLQMQ